LGCRMYARYQSSAGGRRSNGTYRVPRLLAEITFRESLSTVVEKTVTRIIRHLFRYRRLMAPDGPCAESPCATCFDFHYSTVASYLARGEPIHFVLPAFPAKSPNAKKVVGELPDQAERLALEFLQSCCEQLSCFYAPGARITICSDGHVFSDLVGVTDEDVTAYGQGIADMIRQIGGSSIDLFSLENAFGRASFDHVRTELMELFATPIEQLRARVLADDAARAMFNGIHRFMFEDQSVLRPEQSRSKLREECKYLAYRVIQRSDAWSKLVAKEFPEAVRLSIHPQPAHSEKIGMHLIRTRDSWLTPWHGVALAEGETFTLVKRSYAEQIGASLIWRNNRPSHFVAVPVALQEVV